MKTISSLLLIMALGSAIPGYASPENSKQQIIGKQQAMKVAQKHNPGRVLSIKLKNTTYHVKLLSTEGEVRTVLINSINGKMINE